MDKPTDRGIVDALGRVAPGSALRDGLDRVLQSGRGGLIVVGDGPDVLNICSGGFLLDAAFTPQRLSELAKMDGAIILANDASRIARANVHLVPNPNVPTVETGTRHRTAERVARSIGVTVIAVSESRKEIQIYQGDQRYPLPPLGRLLDRSNQALQTLERYRTRLGTVSKNLTALEVEDLVTLRDVIEMMQRTEMVLRIANEVERNLLELGSDGGLVRLQLDELVGGVADDRRLLVRDYFHEDATFHIEEAMEALSSLDDEALFDEQRLAKALHLVEFEANLDDHLGSRGYRLLSKLPRLSQQVVDSIVDQFGNLQQILKATHAELEAVPRVQASQVQAIKTGIARLAESSILERYGSE
ncbi:MAG: DNA integrity scanning diadenylate cyclase DisA [Acidimicrobiales bacterium]